MLFERRRIGFVAMLATGAIVAGCGSNDNISIADAKKNLVEDCMEGKESDRKLCECLADELEDKGKTAKQIDDIRKKVNDGDAPTEITTAAVACGTKLATGG